jgi:ankyrin repeat protein
MSLLALSALGCQDDVAQLLVQAGADPNDSGSYYPLHIAAANGNVSLAEFLLDQGAKVDSVNPNGRTPLEVAVRARQLSTVRLLLKRDPDPRRTISKADASVRVLMADAKSPNDMAIAKLLKPYRVQQEAKKH